MLQGEVGLFAARTLAASAIVVDAAFFDEVFQSWSAYTCLDSVTKGKINAFCLGTAEGFWMPCNLNFLPIAYFMNHSCDPNVGFGSGDSFVAKRDILAGEELCWDYGVGESNPRFKMQCRCGTAVCRGVITGNDWQLPELQNRHDGWFLRSLQEKINKLRGQGK